MGAIDASGTMTGRDIFETGWNRQVPPATSKKAKPLPIISLCLMLKKLQCEAPVR